MEPSAMDLGRSCENIVEELCHRSFFADFTIRSPKYYKSGKLEKEAADILILFGETLLAIQIKSKRIKKASGSMNAVESGRVSKAIAEAVHQFRALNEALRTSTFKSFVNGRGIEMGFDRKLVKEVILIVVFVPIWEGDAEGRPQFRLAPTSHPEGPIPIHLFSLDQFTLLLTLLDTLPDFLLYLAARWGLHAERLIAPDSDPVDEWALTAFEPGKLVRALTEHTFIDICGMHKRHSLSIRRLERQEKPSYFIDRLIERFCSAIGVDLPIDSRFKLQEPPNSLRSYNLMIRFFAKLRRRERSQFAEFLLSKVMACERQEIAFRGFKFSEESEDAYVVLVSRSDRDMRRIELSNLVRAVGLKLKAKNVVGLAVSHDWPDSPECDVAVADVSDMKINEALATFTEQGFKKIRSVNR